MMINLQKKEDEKRVILFGTGVYCATFINNKHIDDYEIVALTDNNQDKWGQEINGIGIVSPDNMPPFDQIIIAIRDKEPIVDQLATMGIDDSKILVYDAEKDEVNPYIRDNAYRLLIREAEDRICDSLLKSAYDKGEFDGFRRVLVTGGDQHIRCIESFLRNLGSQPVVAPFDKNEIYAEHDKIIISSADYRECVRYIRSSTQICDIQWLIIPLFDVRSSII